MAGAPFPAQGTDPGSVPPPLDSRSFTRNPEFFPLRPSRLRLSTHDLSFRCFDFRRIRDPHVAGPTARGRHCRHRHLLRCRHLHRLLSEARRQHQRRVLHGRARDDRVDRRPQFRLRQPRLPGTDGLGGLRLSVRHSRHPLVLGRRHPCHALPRHHHDAVLLHLPDALSPRLSPPALRRRHSRALWCLLRRHDHPHERHQHVRHGRGHEGRPRLGSEFLHLGFLHHRRGLRRAGRPALGNLQRGAAVPAHLAGRAAHPDPGSDRSRRLDEPQGPDQPPHGQRIHPPLEHHRPLLRAIPWAFTGPASSSASAW